MYKLATAWAMAVPASIKEVTMRRVVFLGIALLAASVMLPLSVALADVDDGSKITITSPQDGAKVGDTFELKYELTKGSKAAHGHVYLDGEPQKKFPGTFKGLSQGKHEIKVQAASHDHELLAATDTVTVEVQ